MLNLVTFAGALAAGIGTQEKEGLWQKSARKPALADLRYRQVMIAGSAYRSTYSAD